ncbi:hypothetical protein [Halomarina oriensis]|uniref:Uncharacterized protein n=1 Tax=Halomarina oriensis TaxID=671145 RepID=A0A6B0GXR1_9EURY|nr:hypothetical protein [Halomarina oriensis]MWG36568.1 hypothetical protein [Halomarina oriensis]
MFWTVIDAGATLLAQGFENGLGMFDRVDSAYTSTNHALPESDGQFGAGFDGSQYSQEELAAYAGSLERDFEPGTTVHVAYEKLSGDGVNVYFGLRDGSLLTRYHLVLYPRGGSGGYALFHNDGSRSTLRDASGVANFPADAGNWGHIYLTWDPPAGDPRDGDSDPTGDWLLEVQNQAHEPLVTDYIDAGDTRLRDGGLAFVQSGGNGCFWDDPQIGDHTAFAPAFDPLRHHAGPAEIHSFEHADLFAFGSADNRRQFRCSSAPPTLGQAFVLANPAGTGFSQVFSRPDGAVTDQRHTLPNYHPDGTVADIYLRADQLQGRQDVYYAAAGGDDYLRFETRYGEDRLRVLTSVTGTPSVEFDSDDGAAPGLSGDQWYRLRSDRTVAGDDVRLSLDRVATDRSVLGSVVDVTVSVPSALAGNAGVGLGGAQNTATTDATFFFADWALA